MNKKEEKLLYRERDFCISEFINPFIDKEKRVSIYSIQLLTCLLYHEHVFYEKFLKICTIIQNQMLVSTCTK